MYHKDRINLLLKACKGISAFTVSRMLFSYLNDHAANPEVSEGNSGIIISYIEAGKKESVFLKA